MSDNIHIAFHHTEPTEAIKEFVHKKLDRLHKYVDYSLDINVVLSVEKQVHKAELTCLAEHKRLVSTAQSDDMYRSIDEVVTRMEAQLRKERDRKKGHHSGHRIEVSEDPDQAALPHTNKRSAG